MSLAGLLQKRDLLPTVLSVIQAEEDFSTEERRRRENRRIQEKLRDAFLSTQRREKLEDSSNPYSPTARNLPGQGPNWAARAMADTVQREHGINPIPGHLKTAMDMGMVRKSDVPELVRAAARASNVSPSEIWGNVRAANDLTARMGGGAVVIPNQQADDTLNQEKARLLRQQRENYQPPMSDREKFEMLRADQDRIAGIKRQHDLELARMRSDRTGQPSITQRARAAAQAEAAKKYPPHVDIFGKDLNQPNRETYADTVYNKLLSSVTAGTPSPPPPDQSDFQQETPNQQKIVQDESGTVRNIETQVPEMRELNPKQQAVIGYYTQNNIPLTDDKLRVLLTMTNEELDKILAKIRGIG